jgi:hypothetical protein
MGNYRGILSKLSVWLIAALLFGSCQSDLVENSPVQPLQHSEAKTAVSGRANEAHFATEGLPDGLIGQLLGRITRLVTPLLGGVLPIRDSRLEIPPLAVLSPLLVTWELRMETPVGLTDPLSRTYEFWPNGYLFLRSITLRVSFADAGLGDRDPSQYRFFYYNEVSRSWEPQPTVVDMANQQFVVTLGHFSRYAFGR